MSQRHLRLKSLKGTHAVWEFYDPSNPSVAISEGSGDVADLIEEARTAKKSQAKYVEAALAERFSVNSVPVVEEGVAVSEVTPPPPVQAHWHEEFERLGDQAKQGDVATGQRIDSLASVYAQKDHEHPWLMPLKEAIEKLNAGLENHASEIDQLRFDLKHHGHDVPDHPHAGTQAQIDALRELQAALQAQITALPPAPDLSTMANAESVQKALIALREGLISIEATLNQRIDAVQTATPVLPPILLREDVQDMIEASKPKAGKRTFVLQSQQEVAGKQRYVLDEV